MSTIRKFLTGPIPVFLLAAGSIFTPYYSSAIATAEEPKEEFRVFIRTDDQGKPVDDLVFLPSTLLDIIRQTNDVLADETTNWSFFSAKYQGEFAFNPLTKRLILPILKATYEIQVRSVCDVMTISLPNMPLVPDGAKWGTVRSANDTVPWMATTIQSTEPNSLTFSLNNVVPGVYQLELTLAPVVDSVDGTRLLRFAIPRVVDSSLELMVPNDAPTVTIANTVGAVYDTTKSSQGILAADIGAVDSLVLNWVDDVGRNPQVAVDVDQLFWIRVRPNQIDVRALFKFRISGGSVRQLSIVPDPKLQLSGQYRCAEAELIPESTDIPTAADKVTRLGFPTPVTGTITIRADYVYVARSSQGRISGIGQIRVPNLTATQAKVGQSWLAVSCDPQQECQMPPATMNIEKFRQEWGPSTEIPLSVFDMNGMDPNWVLATRMKPLEQVATVTQATYLQSSLATHRFRIDIETRGDTYQQEIRIPQELQVDTLQLFDAKNDAVDCRWWVQPNEGRVAGDEGRVNLFFTRPVSGKYVIHLTCRQLLPMSSSLETARPYWVPMLDLPAEVRVATRELAIYRDHSFLVQPQIAGTYWQPTELLPTFPLTIFDAVFVCALKSLDSAVSPMESVELTLRQNTPAIHGRQLTAVRRAPTLDQWEVAVDYSLEITGGTLDFLRFQMDRLAVGPFISDPTMTVVEESPQGGAANNPSRYLRAIPTVPLTGKVQFRLKFFTSGNHESAMIPKFQLMSHSYIHQYVQLARQFGVYPLQWDLKHLVPATPETIEEIQQVTGEPVSMSGQSLCLASVHPDFQASIRATKQHARIPLCDVSLFLRNTGHLYGVAAFDLVNSGEEFCELAVPTETELICVSILGTVVQPTPLSGGRVRIPLWNNPYPQRIEVMFSGQLDDWFHTRSSWRNPLGMSSLPVKPVSLSLPTVVDTPAETTLWNVSFENPLPVGTARYSVSVGSQPFRGVVAETTTTSSSPSSFSSSSGNTNTTFVSGIRSRDLPEYLFRMNAVRLESRQTLLDGVTGNTVSGGWQEFVNWYSNWGQETAMLRKENELLEQSLDQIPGKEKPAIFFCDDRNLEGRLRLLGEPMSTLSRHHRALRTNHNTTVGRLGLETVDVECVQRTDIPLNVFLVWRMYFPENCVYLFGGTNQNLSQVDIVVQTPPWRIWNSGILLYPLLVTSIGMTILLARRMHFYHFFSHYPYFCSTAIGIFCWAVLGLNLVGLTLLLLTLISGLYPVGWRNRDGAPVFRAADRSYF